MRGNLRPSRVQVFFFKSERYLAKMILCLKCHCATEVAYNELCYDCYKQFRRMVPKDRKSTLISDQDS